MTEQQKSVIKTLRQQNFSYNAIANTLGLTVSTVKSYCQRSGLAGNRKEACRSNHLKPSVLPSFCICCGKQITQKEKFKRRIFCTDECRIICGTRTLNRSSAVIRTQSIVSVAEKSLPTMVQIRRSSVAIRATSNTGMKE